MIRTLKEQKDYLLEEKSFVEKMINNYKTSLYDRKGNLHPAEFFGGGERDRDGKVESLKDWLEKLKRIIEELESLKKITFNNGMKKIDISLEKTSDQWLTIKLKDIEFLYSPIFEFLSMRIENMPKNINGYIDEGNQMEQLKTLGMDVERMQKRAAYANLKIDESLIPDSVGYAIYDSNDKLIALEMDFPHCLNKKRIEECGHCKIGHTIISYSDEKGLVIGCKAEEPDFCKKTYSSINGDVKLGELDLSETSTNKNDYLLNELMSGESLERHSSR